MKKSVLKEIIKKEIFNILKEQAATPPQAAKPPIKQSSIVTTISKDLADQKSNFALLRQRETILQLLDDIAKKLGPKTIESPAFKGAVKAFYNKHK